MRQIIFLIASLAGIADSLYLTLSHYKKTTLECNLISGCDKVTSSQYSTIYDIPISLFGLFYYTVILTLTTISIATESKRLFNITAMLTIIGFTTSLFLVYIQIAILNAICLYCMMSALTSTVLFITAIIHLYPLRREIFK